MKTSNNLKGAYAALLDLGSVTVEMKAEKGCARTTCKGISTRLVGLDNNWKPIAEIMLCPICGEDEIQINQIQIAEK